MNAVPNPIALNPENFRCLNLPLNRANSPAISPIERRSHFEFSESFFGSAPERILNATEINKNEPAISKNAAPMFFRPCVIAVNFPLSASFFNLSINPLSPVNESTNCLNGSSIEGVTPFLPKKAVAIDPNIPPFPLAPFLIKPVMFFRLAKPFTRLITPARPPAAIERLRILLKEPTTELSPVNHLRPLPTRPNPFPRPCHAKLPNCFITPRIPPPDLNASPIVLKKSPIPPPTSEAKLLIPSKNPPSPESLIAEET